VSVFVYPMKVLFHHCDPAGIVFYPRYFEMINMVVEAWFDERLGLSFEAMHAQGAAVPTARIAIAFTAPSRHGDRLEFRLRPTRLGRTSLDLAIEAWAGDELRLEMTAAIVHVAKPAMRPAPWPEAVAAAIRGELAPPTEAVPASL
jgi:4-hydroxybenzoyl-CoA thioesterase